MFLLDIMYVFLWDVYTSEWNCLAMGFMYAQFGHCQTIFQSDSPICIPTNGVKEFQLLHVLANSCCW